MWRGQEGLLSARILVVQMLRLSLLLLIVLPLWPGLSAQAVRSDGMRVVQESWTVQDGAPESITSLAQTTDGFLWLGSPTGLFRFDGTHFERFRALSGDQLLSSNVYAISAAPSGGLWVGYTFGGFSFVKNGRVTNYAATTHSIHEFAQDANGIVWAASTSGLWRFEHSTWQRIGTEWNAPNGSVGVVAFDRTGVLWVLAQKTLFCLRPGEKRFRIAGENLGAWGFTLDADRKVITNQSAHRQTPRSSGDLDDGLPAHPILLNGSAQIVDRTNSVWILGSVNKPLLRIPSPRRLTDALSDVNAANPEKYDIHPGTAEKSILDNEGNLWFCDEKGIYRFFYNSLNKQELPVELRFPAMAADNGGAMWMSSFYYSDLYRVTDGNVETHHFPGYISRLNDFRGWTLAQRAGKTVWFAGKSGLWHLVDGNFIPIKLPLEMIDRIRYVQAIAEDRFGGVWISFWRYGLYRLADGVWTPFGGREDLPKTGVLTEFSDSLARLWFGCGKSQLAVLDGDRLKVFGPSDGVRVGNITAIYGRGPRIWIGGEFGLQQFDQGRLRNIFAVDNDWLLGISGIIETANGDLWLNGLSGIFKISQAEISRALQDPSYRVKGEHLGRREGLPGPAAQVRPLSTAIEGSDGRLWFAEANGVVWLDPTVPLRPVQHVPISIQSVSADDNDYAPVFPLTLPAHTSSVRINYAAVSLADPEAIHIRYKLLEVDSDWHDAIRHDPVTYRNLSPGSYHFIISDSDTNGVWSDKIVNVGFTILPAWYQTSWFRIGCIGTFLLLLWFLYQLRLQQLQLQFNMTLEARVGERTRIARELHDTLLQSFQGLMLRFQAVDEMLPVHPMDAKKALEGALERGDQAISEGRDAITHIRAPVLTGHDLAKSITALMDNLSEEFGQGNGASIMYRVLVQGAPRIVHPALQGEIYRIARESLRNAFRHAQARQIETEIIYGESLRLRFRDDGKGLDPSVVERGGRPGHWGLPGIRERARQIGAHLEVWSELGAGTEVELSIPGSIAYRVLPAKARFRIFPKRMEQDYEQRS
jgi:signal transduction histidine kinase/ligand-binding sensor domain-containing protein